MVLETDQVLKKLIDATEEAKATTRDLHAARATALDVLKKQRKEIAEGIKTAVDEAVAELGAEARERLVTSVEGVIAGIERDWRQALGLEDLAK